MKVLTAGEMRRVDRLTMELGIPEPILMENAGHRVVEYLTNAGPILAKNASSCCVGKATMAATVSLSRGSYLPALTRLLTCRCHSS